MGLFDSVFDIGKSILGASNPVVSLASSVIGGLFASDDVSDTNQANSAEAALNRQYQSQEAAIARGWQADQISQERNYQLDFANSAYQRGTQDLKAAGLNPMLSLIKGGADSPRVNVPGASAPHGAQAVHQPAKVAGINTALSLAQGAAQVENIRAGTAKLEAEKELVKSQTGREDATKHEIMQRVSEIMPAEKARIIVDTVLKNTEGVLNRARLRTEVERKDLTESQTRHTETSIGHLEAQIKEVAARIGLTSAQTQETLLLLPRLRNMAAQEESSWIKKEITPFLPELQTGARGLGLRGLRVR